MSRHWMAATALAGLLSGLACAATPAARPTAAPAATLRSEAEVPRIDLAQFKQAFDAKTVAVVDTRSEQAFAVGHIPGAVVWDPDPAKLDAQAALLRAAKKKTIVTYCT